MRYWHSADIGQRLPCPLLGVRADIEYVDVQRSAFDPKRTYRSPLLAQSSWARGKGPARGPTMRRREFIVTFLGGAVAASPLAARAQEPNRVRRIGALMSFAESDQEGQARFAAFRESLRSLGWIERRNIVVEVRWATSAEVDTGVRKGTCRPATRTYSFGNNPYYCVSTAANTHYSPCLCECLRSGRQWLCREPVAAGWQHYRIHQS